MINWVANKIMEFRIILIILSILTLCICLSGIRFIEFSPDIDNFFPENHSTVLAHKEVEDTFTTTDNLVIAIGSKEGTIFQPRTLDLIEKLTEQAWTIPHSVRVDSLSNYSYVSAVGDDLYVEPFIEDTLSMSKGEISKKETLIENEPLAYGSIISKDKKTTLINITVDPPRLDVEKEYGETVTPVLNLLETTRVEYPELEIKISGMVYVEYLSPRIIKAQFPILIPLLFIVILVSLYFLLRSITAVTGSLIIIVSSVGSAMGLTGWYGGLVTQPFMMVPILISTLAVADCVHLFSIYFQYRLKDMDSKESMLESLKLNLQPLFLTSITTAIGFLSLNLTPIEPLRTLGNSVFFGVLLAFFFTIFLLAPLCSFFAVSAPKRTEQHTNFAKRIGKFSILHAKRLFWVVPLVSVLLISFIPLNHTNDSPMEFYSERFSPLTSDTMWLNERLGGTFPVNYQLSTDTDSISNPTFLAEVEKFKKWLELQPEVLHVSSLSTTMKKLNSTLHGGDQKWNVIPKDQDLSSQYLFFYEMSLPFGLDLNNSISQDRLSTKITASLSELGSLEYKGFADRVDKYVANNMPENMVSEGTGQRAIFVYMGQVILENLSYALSVGLVMITLTIILFFKSFKLGILTTIPNILPIGVAFGIWGLLVSEVSFLTALGMGTTLGIVVDFTVHLLSKYLHAKNTLGFSKEEAIIYGFETVGFPLIIMTFILICGFMVLLWAYFVPMHGFALFSSLAFFVALILDLFYFPALLLKFDKN
ncbi:MAG: MMPL family transporter [SAR86 cluster bacterium]|jgi:uncharacterized protein|nr:MMPL family transporter [SAR86 cluster bacterium]